MPTPAANPKQIDHSTIPPAARRAAEEAERIRAEQYPEPANTPGGDSPAPPTLPEPSQPPVEAGPPAETQPAPGDPPAPADDPPAPDENDQSWKQRFESEVGRTRKLRKDMAGLSSRIDELQMLLATVQAPAPQQVPAAPEAPSLLTPEEKEEWGAMLPIVEKRFNELMPSHVHKLEAELDNLKARLEGQGQKAQQGARAALLQFMDGHQVLGVATDTSWRDINQDDGFKEWLQYPDVMSGRTRQSLLQEAYDTNDAPRFAAIFASFLREAGHHPAPAAAPTNGSGQASHEPPAAGKGLERFAAPGPARTAPTPSVPAAQEIITTGDITRFYTDKQLGKWKGREKEMEDYERRIFAAGNSNRVRPGPPSP
jgi:hypothetical protein